MDRTGVVVYALFATIFAIVGVLYVKRREEKKREIFAEKIEDLIISLKEESYKQWGHTVSYRYWSLRINDFIKEKLSRYSTCEDYIAFCVLSEKEWKGCKKLDFLGEESVEKFLQGLLEGIRKYSELSIRAIREFTKIEGFSAPYDVFVKMQGDKCIFLYLDRLNYCTCAEAVIEIEQIDRALNKRQADYLTDSITVIISGQSVGMGFRTPVGWLSANFTREDFERAFNEAQKS